MSPHGNQRVLLGALLCALIAQLSSGVAVEQNEIEGAGLDARSGRGLQQFFCRQDCDCTALQYCLGGQCYQKAGYASACGRNNQCLSQVCCNYTSTTPWCPFNGGVCSDCGSDSDCGTNEWCNLNLPVPTCQPPTSTDGGYCTRSAQCVPGLYCDPLRLRCTTQLPQGSSCQSDDQCGPNLYCLTVGNRPDGTCTLAGVFGASCNSNTPCVDSLRCDPNSGVCNLKLGANQRGCQSDADCGGAFWCNGIAPLLSPSCSDKLQGGAFCTHNTMCISNVCQTGRCTNALACTNDYQCDQSAGFGCFLPQGVCMLRRNEGATCTSNNQCLTGQCLSTQAPAGGTYCMQCRAALDGSPTLICHDCTIRPTMPVSVVIEKPKLILFGDSITERSFVPDQGWGAMVAHSYARQVDVVNRGLNGYNTRWALHVLDNLFNANLQNVSGAIVFLGANDAALPTSATQYVPIPEFRQNLETIVSKIRMLPSAPQILLITPPPIYEPARVHAAMVRQGKTSTEGITPDRTNENTKLYAEATKQVGESLSVPVLDVHSALQQLECWQTTALSDGLHLTPAGSRALGELVVAALREHWSNFTAEDMPVLYPLWDMINPQDPGSSFKQYGL